MRNSVFEEKSCKVTDWNWGEQPSSFFVVVFVLLSMSRAVCAFSTLFLLSLLKIEMLKLFPFSDSEKRFLFFFL